MTVTWQPNDDQTKLIRDAAAMGIPWVDIAVLIKPLGCTLTASSLMRSTGAKAAYDEGRVRANYRVANHCFKLASSGNNPSMTQFWLRTRAGWKDYDGLVVIDNGSTAAAEVINDRLTKLQRSLERVAGRAKRPAKKKAAAKKP